MSQLKIKNGSSWEAIPAGGVGVPSGGTADQYLKKTSSMDYATEWADFPETPVVELSATVTKSSGASSVSWVKAYQYGKVVQVTVRFVSGNSVNAGSNSFEGQISGVPIPAATVIGCGYISTSALLGYIGTGDPPSLVVHVLAATKGSSTTNYYDISWTYVASA